MQRTPHSFIKNGKERKERSVLFIQNAKECENVAFFWKERKRMQERCVLLKRKFAQPWHHHTLNISKYFFLSEGHIIIATSLGLPAPIPRTGRILGKENLIYSSGFWEFTLSLLPPFLSITKLNILQIWQEFGGLGTVIQHLNGGFLCI